MRPPVEPSQYTSQAFTGALEARDIRISMGGEGAWRDNVFIERFWWSVKYEHVYLHAYDDLRVAREGIGSYIEYYNHDRRHSSLEKLTPVAANEQNQPLSMDTQARFFEPPRTFRRLVCLSQAAA